MRLIIVAADAAIGVNGVFVQGADLSFLPSGVSAVQWYGAYGFLEHNESEEGVTPPNTRVTELPFADAAVAAWTSAAQSQQSAREAAVVPYADSGTVTYKSAEEQP
jgi:hypothetical protein